MAIVLLLSKSYFVYNNHKQIMVWSKKNKHTLANANTTPRTRGGVF